MDVQNDYFNVHIKIVATISIWCYQMVVKVRDEEISKDCFSLTQPTIVPAKTLLSQLV